MVGSTSQASRSLYGLGCLVRVLLEQGQYTIAQSFPHSRRFYQALSEFPSAENEDEEADRTYEAQLGR